MASPACLPINKSWKFLSRQAVPAEACRQLIDAANQAGGKDNITAVILVVGNDAVT